jgi:cyclopropane-fatty-acyl-phospholipid synthase
MPFSRSFQQCAIALAPDALIRWGIRRLLRQKLNALACRQGHPALQTERQQAALQAFVEALRQAPIALHTDTANLQHYALPPAFFGHVLGPRRKYSSAYWTPTTRTLAEAEDTMLALTAQRAQLLDGQTILDLGCGWGSLTLWLAERFPKAQIWAVSNAQPQIDWIQAQCDARGYHHVHLQRMNVATDNPEAFSHRFDRIVSVEMMEHLKNYGAFFDKVQHWLRPEGMFFVHIFTHRLFAYHYDEHDPNDWLTPHFFAGGTMPSADLLHYFCAPLVLDAQWSVSGQHYEKTANAWLANQDAHRREIWPILEATYGPAQAQQWWHYWRVFWMACAELWGYDQGRAWGVTHYRFFKPSVVPSSGGLWPGQPAQQHHPTRPT